LRNASVSALDQQGMTAMSELRVTPGGPAGTECRPRTLVAHLRQRHVRDDRHVIRRSFDMTSSGLTGSPSTSSRQAIPARSQSSSSMAGPSRGLSGRR
jgi:hypothetical protein